MTNKPTGLLQQYKNKGLDMKWD